MTQDSRFEVIPLVQVAAECMLFDQTESRPLVLIVDDERVIADTLTIILAKSGYATLTAYSAESALEIAALIPPNLLLSDVVMPGINGVDLAARLVRDVPDCEVLLFSGQASTVDLNSHAGYSGRSFTMLSKPLHPTELLKHIADSLKAARANIGESVKDAASLTRSKVSLPILMDLVSA